MQLKSMLFKGQLHIRKEKNIWWGSSFSFEQIKSEAQQIAGSGAQCEVKTGDQQSCDQRRQPRERNAERTEPQGMTQFKRK